MKVNDMSVKNLYLVNRFDKVSNMEDISFPVCFFVSLAKFIFVLFEVLQLCELGSHLWMASKTLQFVPRMYLKKAPTRSEARDLRLHIVKWRNSYCEVRHSISLVFIFKCHCITMSKLLPRFLLLMKFLSFLSASSFLVPTNLSSPVPKVGF